MNISCIIPTYNRTDSLDLLLQSINKQTLKPTEILIIDNSDESYIGISNFIKNKYNAKNIHYFRNPTGNSLTRAKNYGVTKAKSDIVLFLDDDLILEKEYIAQIIEVYKQYPNAVGVQGYIKNTKYSKLLRLVYNTKKMNIAPSGWNVAPYNLKKVMNCEWMSGGNSSYKKEIFKFFKFDEKLNKYCFKEDVDLSYRVFKKYPNGLFITPNAVSIHETTPITVQINKERIYMKTVYQIYFFLKNIKQTNKNKFHFIFRELCYFLIELIRAVRQQNPIRVKYLLGSYLFSIKHIKELKEKDLDFFDKILFNNN